MFRFDLGFHVDVYAGYAVPPSPVAVVVSEDHHKSGISLHLPVLGFAVAGALFLLVCLLFLCCYCLKTRLRSYGVVERREVGEILINSEPVQLVEDHPMDVDHPIWYIRTQGLQQSVIDSISIVKFKKNEGLVEGSDCSICLSEFEEDESLRLLPKCAHAFHVPCIDQWFRSHKSCPLCRSPIVNVTMSAAQPDFTTEENRVGLERRESDETVTGDVNISQEVPDLNSTVSQNERNELLANKDSSFSGSSNSKPECDLAKSVDENEIRQTMRRSVSAGPVTTSNLCNAVADIKIHINSDASAQSDCSPMQKIKATSTKSSMKRSVSYGGKTYAKSGRSQKSILPY